MKNTRSFLQVLLAACALLLSQGHLLQAAETPGPKAFAVTVTGSGRPMLLIPGLACGGNVWDGTVAHFKDSYQCHVFTLAGFAGQPAMKGPFLEQVRDALIQYMAEQKLERPIIIGHSLGGFMAFSLASSIPERVGPVIAVDGAPFVSALQDASATPDSAAPLAKLMQAAIEKQSREQFAGANRGVLATMITDPKELTRIGEVCSQSDPKAVGQALFELFTTDLRDKVKVIQTPVLYLGATAPLPNADLKQKTEENTRLQVSTIPNHKVVFAPKARHFIQLDEPEFFFHEVESFLKDAETTKGR